MDGHTFFVFAALFVIASVGFFFITSQPTGLFIESTPAFEGEYQAHNARQPLPPRGAVITGELAEPMCQSFGYKLPCTADKQCPGNSVTFSMWNVRYCCCE